MNSSALLFMLSVFFLITGITIYLFYKTLSRKNKKK